MRPVWSMFIWLLVIGCNQSNDSELTIAVASNMHFAMEEIVSAFENESGQNCNTVLSSSGKLTAQIIEGAPFDILVSADMKYPNRLYQAGLTTGKPAIYAYGSLVLWSTIDGLDPSLDRMLLPEVKHIAIANPRTAPYGIAALEILEHNELLRSIEDKLVYGESISQTNQFIISGVSEMGITAKSVVMSDKMKDTGQWTDLSKNQYTPLAQSVVILHNENSVESREFFEYLFSSKAQAILQKYGYDLVD